MFGKDDNPEVRLRKQFWKELGDDRTVMLGIEGVDDDQTRPMTAQIDQPDGADDEDGGTIYFFGSKSEGLGQNLAAGAQAVATFVSKGHGLFAHLHGTLHPSADRSVIERLWNPIVASWYKDGKDDPDLLLIRFDATRAEVWESTPAATFKAAALKLMFNVDLGKEQAKEHKADVGL